MITSYYITAEASKIIIDESQKSLTLENGGILIGKFSNSCAIVRHAIGPGPKAQRSPHRFKRDGEFSQSELDRYVKRSAGEFDYVGEWHSHPQYIGPSWVDLNSMAWIAANPAYLVKNPLLLICSNTNREWIIECFLCADTKLNLLSRSIMRPQSSAS